MRPDIVLIISDAVRARDLSLYGNIKETDKYLKKIASESVTFNLNFSASNASDPSVTSLFSGKYPLTSGFIHQHPFEKKEEIDKLRKNKFWLPIYLRDKGYITISGTPLHMWFKKGFLDYQNRDDKIGKKKILNTSLIKRILLNLPSGVYSFGKKIIKTRASASFHSSREVIDSSIFKIKRLDKPFFLFMHLTDTHYPYPIAPKRKNFGKKTLDKILEEIESIKQREYIKKRFTDISAYSIEEIEERRDFSFSFVDKQIWRLYEFLRKRGTLKNTIFIVLSDHGDNFGDHQTYFCRGGLYDSSIHVPLVMHLPKIGHKKINELTQNIDIAPTILEILGEKNIKLDGKSVLNMIRTGGKIRDRLILSDGFCEDRSAIRTKAIKTISSKGGKCYLCGAIHGKGKEEYNLKKDPQELKNIWDENSNLKGLIKV